MFNIQTTINILAGSLAESMKDDIWFLFLDDLIYTLHRIMQNILDFSFIRYRFRPISSGSLLFMSLTSGNETTAMHFVP